MAVLKIKKNGVWEELGVFNAGVAEPEIFIVTVNADSMTSSHSAAEIKEAYENDKLVALRLESNTIQYGGFISLAQIISEDVDNISAFFNDTHVSSKYKVSTVLIIIRNDKSVLIDEIECAPIPAPTESDYGKVLTATASGLAWVTAE